jgi:hypothetical protein
VATPTLTRLGDIASRRLFDATNIHASIAFAITEQTVSLAVRKFVPSVNRRSIVSFFEGRSLCPELGPL